MPSPFIYFYRRDNKYGYDQITLVAFTKEQADTLLKNSVINPEEWLFCNWDFITINERFDYNIYGDNEY